MADKPTATFNDMRIDNQQLAFTVTVNGAQGAYGEAQMRVYDASGRDLQYTPLGRIEAGQPWTAALDLIGATEGDGDYAVWVTVQLNDENDNYVDVVDQGVSFLVGRGRIYPSSEKPAEMGMDELPEVSALRFEGDWVVADVKNPHAYDLPISHWIMLFLDGDTLVHEEKGQELLQANATQQIHHMLPNDLADGRYFIPLGVRVDGVLGDSVASGNIEVRDGQITVLPS